MNNPNEDMSHLVEIVENAMKEDEDNQLNESNDQESEESYEDSTEIPVGYSITSEEDGWVWSNDEMTSEIFNSEQDAIEDAQRHFNENKDHLEE